MKNQEFRECQRCWWKWVSRHEGAPRICPHCKSLRWQEPFTDSTPKREFYGAGKMKFPVDTLQVGESLHLPWIKTEAGEFDAKANASRPRSIAAWARRNGRKFFIDPAPGGIVVRRAS